MNKRERLLHWLTDSQMPRYVPAAFFIHFPQEYRRGQAAIDKHLEYFHYTGSKNNQQHGIPCPERPTL